MVLAAYTSHSCCAVKVELSLEVSIEVQPMLLSADDPSLHLGCLNALVSHFGTCACSQPAHFAQ